MNATWIRAWVAAGLLTAGLPALGNGVNPPLTEVGVDATCRTRSETLTIANARVIGLHQDLRGGALQVKHQADGAVVELALAEIQGLAIAPSKKAFAAARLNPSPGKPGQRIWVRLVGDSGPVALEPYGGGDPVPLSRCRLVTFTPRAPRDAEPARHPAKD